VTTASHGGLYGSWLVDPQDFTVAASGGDISGATLSAELANTSVTLQSSGGAKSGHGDVSVNDAVSWSSNTSLGLIAVHNVNVMASLTATGAGAGVTINPDTANGSAPASGRGVFHLGTYSTIRNRYGKARADGAAGKRQPLSHEIYAYPVDANVASAKA